jgi:CRP-like cAMP-binding protein
LDALVTTLKRIAPLTPKAIEDFLPAWKQWIVPKGHLLLKEKSVSDYMYFLEKGAIRIFYHKNGKEVTEWLSLDESFFLSINSFFERTPSYLNIQTIEASHILGIHYNDFMALADEHHAIEKLLRKMVTQSLILSQHRMQSIQFETAQQRYERLIATTPEIIKRVPLSYIASFLGITLETLSRIRASK